MPTALRCLRAAARPTVALLLLAAALAAGAPMAQASPKAKASGASEHVTRTKERARRCTKSSRRRHRRHRLRKCASAHTALNRPRRTASAPALATNNASGGAASWVGDFETGDLSQWDGRD